MKHLIEEPLTNKDIERILPAARGRILEYSEQTQYGDLEELLPDHNSFDLILIE